MSDTTRRCGYCGKDYEGPWTRRFCGVQCKNDFWREARLLGEPLLVRKLGIPAPVPPAYEPLTGGGENGMGKD